MSELPVFLDVEASGIAGGAYPIEVGHAAPRPLGGGRAELVLRSHLIRPAGRWLAVPGAWDAAAEPVHGLTREVLEREGRPVEAVCDALDAELAGRSVHADTGADGWDAGWIAALYEAAGRAPRWQLSERASGAAVAERYRALGLAPRVVRPLLRPLAPPATHAAAEDARRYAWEWAVAEGLAAAGLRGATVAEAGAILDALPSPPPPELRPGVSADSAGRFRAR